MVLVGGKWSKMFIHLIMPVDFDRLIHEELTMSNGSGHNKCSEKKVKNASTEQ
jgi:hypothetical protein